MGTCFLVFVEEGTRKIKCGADERRRQRLDGAEPLFLSRRDRNANESLPVYHIRTVTWIE